MSGGFGMRAPKGPARPGAPGRPPRPANRTTALPEGQKIIKRMRNLAGQQTGGPGEPPPGFVSGTTSAEEWAGLYWPLAVIFNDPEDPREPPFYGSRLRTWEFQSPQMGGRSRSGGAVIDAVVYTETGTIGMRLVTEYFHMGKGSKIQANDALQRVNLMRSGYMNIVDIFSGDVVGDASGETAIKVIKDALALIQRPDPLLSGAFQKVTRGKIG